MSFKIKILVCFLSLIDVSTRFSKQFSSEDSIVDVEDAGCAKMYLILNLVLVLPIFYKSFK